MADYTWIDYIIFLVFFLSVILGLARGLFRELISILVLVVAFVIAIKFTLPVATYLNSSQGALDVLAVISKFVGANWSVPLALFTLALTFLVLFVGTLCIGEAVNFYASPNTFMTPGISLIYRLFGGGVGFIRGYALNVVFVLIAQITPVTQDPAWTQSFFVPKLLPAATRLGEMIQPGGFGNFSKQQASQ